MVPALLGLLLLAGIPDSASGPPGLALTYNAVLKVDDPEAGMKTLVADAEALGGYFARESKNRVELRLPASKSQAFWKSLPRYGLLLDQNLGSENLASMLTDLDARLGAKRKTMEQYLALLQSANDTTLFQIENAVAGLQQEIDSEIGQKNLAQDRVRYARVILDFSFHDRSAPLPSGNTRFAWLNALGLQNLLDRMDFGSPQDAPHAEDE